MSEESVNKREEQKLATRRLIIRTAKEEFIEKGFLQTKTAAIAKRAGIAHGTLFSHFASKEELIVEVFSGELMKMNNELHSCLDRADRLEELLESYLDYLAGEEQFFSTINKELPHYEDSLRREIFFRESGIRGYFYKAIEKGIEAGEYKEVDLTMCLTFLFGTINYLLCNRESLVGKGSIVKEKRGSIIETFLKMIKM